MSLPDFIIIGAQKCGTSSLHYYLSLHPEIFMSGEKELQFFSRDDRWGQGLDWYRSRFQEAGDRLAGESSPQYTWHPFAPDVAERMHSVLPDAKLIYVVRDPINRLLSQYIDYLYWFWEDRPLEEALADVEERPNRYIETGCYHYQLEQYLRFYKPEDILVIGTEELSEQTAATMKETLGFLGVDARFRTAEWEKRRNKGEGKRLPNRFFRALMTDRLRFELLEPTRLPQWAARGLRHLINITGSDIETPKLSDELERRLVEIYADDVRKLREFSGKQFVQWREY